jgi:thymidylate kinase
MLKIAFIGTHGANKTTHCYELASALKKLDKNVYILQEVARECPFPVNEKVTFETQMWMLTTQIKREIEVSKQKGLDYLICDRSVIDVYAYMIRKAEDECSPIIEFVYNWAETYDYIFRCKPIHLKNDCFRSTSKEFQTDIDNIFDRLNWNTLPIYPFYTIENVLKTIKGNK